MIKQQKCIILNLGDGKLRLSKCEWSINDWYSLKRNGKSVQTLPECHSGFGFDWIEGGLHNLFPQFILQSVDVTSEDQKYLDISITWHIYLRNPSFLVSDSTRLVSFCLKWCYRKSCSQFQNMHSIFTIIRRPPLFSILGLEIWKCTK